MLDRVVQKKTRNDLRSFTPKHDLFRFSHYPLMNLMANIIRVISGIGQKTLISLFGNMLTRLEICVDQNG